MAKRSKKASFQLEKAIERIEEIVKQLEEGKLPLEKAIEMFAEGMELIALCQKKLDEAQEIVQKLVQDSKGAWKVEPFEASNDEIDG
ncbi:MAG: exodeoxyribonuclease VII small subunit [Deltaproteobacteria bacterium]|nr:exodeoxyribonuclease VII small subunit [Deltaproteobacteria bacterium]MBW2067457.1 exodeoxyribonuclease VII small subunit [Deltaproteobacteria bacterium]